MPSTNNVIQIDSFKRTNDALTQQEQIDDIGARAFLLIRNEAQEMGLSIKKVIAEHMLGLTMVIESVEGSVKAKELLTDLESKLS